MTKAAIQEEKPMAAAERKAPLAPGGLTEEQWRPIKNAFELFDRQSRQLQEAYQSLKIDLAKSNEALQSRNRFGLHPSLAI